MGWATIPPGKKRGPKKGPEAVADVQKSNRSQVYWRNYFQWYNATKRGLNYYNRFKQPYQINRYRQVWSQKYGQQTYLQRPAFRPPNVWSGPSMGPLSSPYRGGFSEATPLGRWHSPSLRYEQRNKDWTIYKPFRVQGFPPPKPQMKEATRQANKNYSDYLYTTMPYNRWPPNISDLRFIDTQQPYQRPRQPGKWNYLKRFIPDIAAPPVDPPRETTTWPSQRFSSRTPCFHWDARLQKKVPCSWTSSSKTRPWLRSYGQTISQRYDRQRINRRRFRQRFRSTKNTRYYRRRSRSYYSY